MYEERDWLATLPARLREQWVLRKRGISEETLAIYYGTTLEIVRETRKRLQVSFWRYLSEQRGFAVLPYDALLST